MKAAFIIIIFFFIVSLNLIAQTKSKYIFVKTIDKKDYFYIPQSAFSDSVNGVIYQDKTLSKVALQKKCFRFFWNSICNDGSYYLTITPEQIYFSSGHDNPNPNYLFWVINITNSQYQLLKKTFFKQTPEGFSKNAEYNPIYYFDEKYVDTFSIPENWTDSILKIESIYCENQIKTQLVRYFSLINSYIKEPSKKINFLENKKVRQKYFSSSKQEIIDWMPKKIKAKFTPPKNSE
ncbi:hypothetical protein [Ferruginibacter sp.]